MYVKYIEKKKENFEIQKNPTGKKIKPVWHENVKNTQWVREVRSSLQFIKININELHQHTKTKIWGLH